MILEKDLSPMSKGSKFNVDSGLESKKTTSKSHNFELIEKSRNFKVVFWTVSPGPGLRGPGGRCLFPGPGAPGPVDLDFNLLDSWTCTLT